MRPEHELTPYAPGELTGSPVLLLAPHPDDEIFGCGGFAALAAAERRDVTIVVLTDGGAHGDPETRRGESRAAARRLGLEDPEFLGLVDRELRPNDPRLADALDRLIRDVRPELVLAPSPAELHPDHRAAAVAAYTVLARSPEPPPELRLATYEVSGVLRPNVLLDVTDVWDTVVGCAHLFASQLDDTRYVRIMDAVATARCLTLPAEVERAEAYHVVDQSFIGGHTVAEWAAGQGPVDGLVDDSDDLDVARLRAELAGARAEAAELRRTVEEQRGVLEQLYRSKTWKLHTFLEQWRRR